MTHEDAHKNFERSLRTLSAGMDPECVVVSMLTYIVDIAHRMDEFEAMQLCVAMAHANGAISEHIQDVAGDGDDDDAPQDEA